jgi:hypothetical protein
VALVAVFAIATSVGPTSDTSITDFGLYREYARLLLDGYAPYRDFAVEYPPLGLLPIWLAGLVAGTGEREFTWAFGILMLGCLLIVQREAARLAPPGRERAVAWSMVLLPVAAGAIVRERYDLFVVALTVAGLRLGRGGRSAGAVLLGLGAAAKLFPLLPAAAICAWLLGRGRRADAARFAAVVAGVAIAVCLPFVVLSPGGFADQFRFQLDRPVQVESAPAVVLRVVGDPAASGTLTRPDRYRSQGLQGGDVVIAVFAVLQIAGVLAALLLAARDRDPLIGAVAAVLAFVALGKVLSPQYLLWIAPFAPVLWFHGARAAAALVALATVLTGIEFPGLYPEVVDGETGAVALVAVRDAALIVAAILTTCAGLSTRRRSARG